jgi:hypothetical protein
MADDIGAYLANLYPALGRLEPPEPIAGSVITNPTETRPIEESAGRPKDAFLSGNGMMPGALESVGPDAYLRGMYYTGDAAGQMLSGHPSVDAALQLAMAAAPGFKGKGMSKGFEGLRQAVNYMPTTGKAGAPPWGTLRDALPTEMHEHFAPVLDTPIYLRNDPAAWQEIKKGSRAWYYPAIDPETGESAANGSIHISPESNAGNKEYFANLLAEEAIHALQDAKNRPRSRLDAAGQPLPYEEMPHEITAKKGADYWQNRILDQYRPRPSVLYHGTRSSQPWTEYNQALGSGQEEPGAGIINGMHLTPNLSTARGFAGPNQNVRSYEPQYQNPFIWDADNQRATDKRIREIFPEFKSGWDLVHAHQVKPWTEALRKNGYDAVEVYNNGKIREVGVVDPNTGLKRLGDIPRDH